MTVIVDVTRSSREMADLLATIESGEDVILSRDSILIAKVTRIAAAGHDARAITAVFEAREGLAPTTAAEIRAWRDEGRR